MSFDEPDLAGTGLYLNPSDLLYHDEHCPKITMAEQDGQCAYLQNCYRPGHLIMVWTIDYVADAPPTKFTKPGKKPDAIIVDVVDLDQADEAGYQGLLFRKVWWRQGKLIQVLKNKAGQPNPIIARMTLGVATLGKPPFLLESASSDPEAVARGQAWIAANPNFRPSSSTPPPINSGPAPAWATAPAAEHPPVRPLPPPRPAGTSAEQQSMMQRLSDQAKAGAARLPVDERNQFGF